MKDTRIEGLIKESVDRRDVLKKRIPQLRDAHTKATEEYDRLNDLITSLRAVEKENTNDKV